MTNENQNYNVVYSRVVDDESHHPVTRKLAAYLMHNGYITVGEFLKNLTDRELSDLMYIGEFFAEDIDDEGEEPTYMDDYILIASMLSEAEASGIKLNDTTAHTLVSMFTAFLVIESLHRKGLAKAIHANMSFGEDMNTAVIAKRLDEE